MAKHTKHPKLRDADWLTSQLTTKTLQQVGDELGVTKSAVASAAKMLGVTVRCPKVTRSERWAHLMGQRFGMLVVREMADPTPRSGNSRVLAECDCGGTKVVAVTTLLGKLPGWDHCGCQSLARWVSNGQANATHGGRCRNGRRPERTATYSTWLAMMDRCYRPGTNGYDRYAGEGIVVCERWHSFVHFLEDMGERPEGMSLDRIDVEGNYEPSNCRWATDAEQRRNKRQMLGFTQADWAYIAEMCEGTGEQGDKIAGRIRRRVTGGWA